MISASELTDIWADLAQSYTDVAEVRRLPPPVQRRDRSGGSTASEGDKVAIYPCRLSKDFTPVREQSIGGGLTGVVAGRVYVSPDPEPDIRASDRLYVTDVTGEKAPLLLEVTGMELRLTIDLERIIRAQLIGGPPPPPIVPLQT